MLGSLSASAVAAQGDGITEYTLPTGIGSLVAIAAGPDGNMWFTESGAPGREGLGPGETGAAKIGTITPTGNISEYPLSTPYTTLGGITSGPDGNLWFTETFYPAIGGSPPPLGGAIGRISPTGTVTEFPLPKGGGSSPRAITVGPDGNLWFTTTGFTTTAIGRITPDGQITEYPAHPGYSPYGIAAGHDGILWFTEDFRGRIGRITPAGDVTEYPALAVGYLGAIAAGLDGNLWFTAGGFGSRIARITPSGTTTEFKLPAFDLSPPGGIAVGPDGYLWFTAGNKIGRVSPVGTPLTRWTCPINVTLHRPAPTTVGRRVLTDKISTDFYCLLPRPVVRCRPLAGGTATKTALCDTKITKRGKIRVNATRYEAVRVTVTVGAKPKPKTKAWFPGTWKRDTWRKSWLLR